MLSLLFSANWSQDVGALTNQRKAKPIMRFPAPGDGLPVFPRLGTVTCFPATCFVSNSDWFIALFETVLIDRLTGTI